MVILPSHAEEECETSIASQISDKPHALSETSSTDIDPNQMSSDMSTTDESNTMSSNNTIYEDSNTMACNNTNLDEPDTMSATGPSPRRLVSSIRIISDDLQAVQISSPAQIGSSPAGNNNGVTRKTSLRKRRSDNDSKTHPPLTRKISFPPEELFQSSVTEKDNVELMRVLRNHGDELDINKTNHAGLTGLHQAVLSKNLDGVKLLLFHGCRVDIADAHGFTALHTASACGYISIATFLVLHGADVFARTSAGDLAADLAKDGSMARVLQEEMIKQLHGQFLHEQYNRRPRRYPWILELVVAALKWILWCLVTVLRWLWKRATGGDGSGGGGGAGGGGSKKRSKKPNKIS